MKIGCSSWTFRKEFNARELDLLRFIEVAHEIGLDGIEPLTQDFPSVSDRFLHELRDQLRRFPVELSAIAPVNNFAHADADERRRQVDDLITWVRIARDMDVGILRTFTGYLPEGVDATLATTWVYDAYEKVLPAAERANVTLAVENHSNVMNTPDELVALVMHFGSPALQLNPDPTNFVPRHFEKTGDEREPIYAGLEKIARFAVHSHLKIGTFDDDGSINNIDVPRLLDVYRRHCYDGYVSFEAFSDDDARDCVGKALACLRPLIDAD